MRRLSVAARNIALAGLRRRYLGASDAELTRHLADLVLGEELAARAYGPRASTLACATTPNSIRCASPSW